MKIDNESLQKIYLEFQILSQQLNQLQQQINSITGSIIELKSLENSLEEIKKIKKEDSILIPLGNNLFIKGKLENDKEVIMGVGSKVLVKRGLSDAKTMIDKQIRELDVINLQMEHEVIHLKSQLKNLQKELSKEGTK